MKHLRTPYLILIAAVAALAAASCAKERSTDYDTEMLEFAGNYYGAIGNNGEHCYYICLSDKGFSNSGELIPGALYYYFDIFSTAPSDASLITIPTGLYTLGARGTTAVGTFTQENSIFVRPDDMMCPWNWFSARDTSKSTAMTTEGTPSRRSSRTSPA